MMMLPFPLRVPFAIALASRSTCIIRPFNTFGPRQSSRAIIPTAITQIIKKPKKVRGSSIPFDKDRFTIQVGSKKFLSDAKKFAAQLIDSGYDAYIQKASFKETNEVWYRIRVGSYDKRETATAVAKVLSKTRQEKAWVDFVRYEY